MTLGDPAVYVQATIIVIVLAHAITLLFCEVWASVILIMQILVLLRHAIKEQFENHLVNKLKKL